MGTGFTRFSEEHAQGQLLPRIVDVALARAADVVVADPATRLTGAGLLQRAALVREAVLAHHRADDRDPQEVPVAVLRGHDAGAVAAVVGVVASGHPVVVLDPTTPAVRLRHYVDAAGATLVVSDTARQATAGQVAGTVVDPDSHLGSGDSSDHVAAASALLTRTAAPDDVAVIVYTSGSTGKPKGVACDHRSILHDTWVNSEATGAYPAGSVVAHLLPMAFSAGTTPTLAGLLAGSRLELFDPRRRSVTELPGFLREVGADVLMASPAIMRGVVTTLGPQGRLTGLKTVTMAGETVHGAELSAVRRAVGPDCVLRNRYGSTETWLMTEYAISGDDEAPEGATPVGWAVPGARLQVELEDGTLADTGTGRVVLTSRWLGGRYWRNPEKTAEVFTDNPDGSRTFRTSDVGTLGPDGCLRLLGRSDHSVKIRGLLVEPGEIDALLFAQPDVREALVVGQASPTTGRMRLVAFVVWSGTRPSATAIRAVVREHLPAHMVPEHVEFVDALPRTERGKVDRSALPIIPDATGNQPAANDFEFVVVRLFEDALGLPHLGADADFFAVGGDSLAAQSLLASTERLLNGRRLTTSDLVHSPTPRDFAKRIQSTRGRDRGSLVPLSTTGTETPFFFVAGGGQVALSFRDLVHHLPSGIPVWALQASGLEDDGPVAWSVRGAARRHVEALRTVQPRGPYRLAGFSFGGLVTLEMAHLLKAEGETVDLLVLLDSFPPEPRLMPPAFSPGIRGKVRGAAAYLTTANDLLGGRRDRYDRFFRQSHLLQRRYRGRVWDGRALVLVARDDPDAAARRSWDAHLSGEWAMHEVAGDHGSFLREPVVAHVAHLVSEALGSQGAEYRLRDEELGIASKSCPGPRAASSQGASIDAVNGLR